MPTIRKYTLIDISICYNERNNEIQLIIMPYDGFNKYLVLKLQHSLLAFLVNQQRETALKA